MNRKTSAAAAFVAATIACPLVAHAQSVTIIGEGSGAARNTTGASAWKNTIREDAPGATTVGAGATPSTAGRSDGSGVGANTGTTAGGGGTTGTTAGASGTATGTTGTTGTTGFAGGTTGTTGTTGTSGSTGATGSGTAAGSTGGGSAGGGAGATGR